MIDRMDEALEFPLPSAPERKHIIALYLDQYISQAGTAAGGAGTAAVGLRARLSALLRGQKASADTIRSGWPGSVTISLVEPGWQYALCC